MIITLRATIFSLPDSSIYLRDRQMPPEAFTLERRHTFHARLRLRRYTLICHFAIDYVTLMIVAAYRFDTDLLSRCRRLLICATIFITTFDYAMIR